MNSKKKMYTNLRQLNLSDGEIKIYISLLENPNTHLELARITGINRTKVYRVVDELEKRSLVMRRTDDRGTFLMASDPGALEIELTTREEKLRQQRRILEYTVSDLRNLQSDTSRQFAVHTYEGIKGYKQMIWHELKTQGELLVFGNITLEEQVADRRWSEKFREMVEIHGYKTREIFNHPHSKPNFTAHEGYMKRYDARVVPTRELPMLTPMIIYNDTVAIYQFQDEKRIGTEIINTSYASTMRAIFEHYWQLGSMLESQSSVGGEE